MAEKPQQLLSTMILSPHAIINASVKPGLTALEAA